MKNTKDIELMIPFPSEKLKNGGEIGAWMKGWEAGYREALSKLEDKDWDEMWNEMTEYFPNVENRSLICSQFIKWQMEFIYKKMIQE
jgi:hypothetical protein